MLKNEILTDGISRGVVLPLRGAKPLLIQLILVVTAVVLPAAAHLAGAPVRWLLPMHWSVILAGLMYGWRGGLIVGFAAPLSNWLLTGYPLPLVLPAMTLELAAYGFVAGLLIERAAWSRYLAVAAALIAGRIIFLAAIFATGGFTGAFKQYILAAMIPGLVAGVAQIISLPLLARYFLSKRER